MLRVGMGKVSVLSEMAPSALRQQLPERSHRASWLAGRVLLSTLLSPACVPLSFMDEMASRTSKKTFRYGLTSAIAAMTLR